MFWQHEQFNVKCALRCMQQKIWVCRRQFLTVALAKQVKHHSLGVRLAATLCRNVVQLFRCLQWNPFSLLYDSRGAHGWVQSHNVTNVMEMARDKTIHLYLDVTHYILVVIVFTVLSKS